MGEPDHIPFVGATLFLFLLQTRLFRNGRLGLGVGRHRLREGRLGLGVGRLVVLLARRFSGLARAFWFFGRSALPLLRLFGPRDAWPCIGPQQGGRKPGQPGQVAPTKPAGSGFACHLALACQFLRLPGNLGADGGQRGGWVGAVVGPSGGCPVIVVGPSSYSGRARLPKQATTARWLGPAASTARHPARPASLSGAPWRMAPHWLPGRHASLGILMRPDRKGAAI